MSAQLFCAGRPATAELLAAPALVNYGHFSTMQVRGGAVRGFDLHLQRLDQATRILFGSELPAARVRAELRAALEAFGSGDASLRASVFAPDFDLRHAGAACAPQLLVSLAAPAQPDAAPLRVRSVVFQRELPQIKHAGTFALFHQRRLALQAGFDDALFVDAQGLIGEGSVWNIGFWDGQGVVWPQAPALRGTQERLLQAGLEALGVAQQVRPLRLDALDGLSGGFACNSRGQQAIAALDGQGLDADGALLKLLDRALQTQSWQRI